ncbi:MAG: tRNA uridine-5-carboxymethylaminomethyl(34) synthesis GTPase MnmE [Deltaproteobacteria bacterium]|nr:tRNA uridine-5-carboxymethylaminomethyl(34) synthesis GTPase MnmE [Deltaproteobacteria bacterium]
MDRNELHSDNEPIVALSSGQGHGAIAILRASGRACHELLVPCLRMKKASTPWEARVLTHCDLLDPTDGTVLDDCMAVIFKRPHSYTGQDSVEIYVHGSPYIVKTALALFYRLGFRPAEAGEFTRRAFLSGKIDLSEAEGINALIGASSHQQWLAARHLYSGRLKQLVDELDRQLKEAMAWLEASIDFPDEGDTTKAHRASVLERVDKIFASLQKLEKSYEDGRVASQGLRVALFGEPNVGKSTLMNTLLGTERAIVTEEPGTTRDYLEEACLVNGRLIRLIDTAGVRDSTQKVEKLGIERTYALAREADLVLFLAEAKAGDESWAKWKQWVEDVKPSAYLQVLTKCDLVNNLKSLKTGYAEISCRTGLGIEALKDRIVAKVNEHVRKLEDEPFLSSARHKRAVEEALEALRRFYTEAHVGGFDEVLAFELQQAARALVSIIGRIDTEEILDVVFASFCVGK